MGPFVLCSASNYPRAWTPQLRTPPPKPLRSRKDRESGLCNNDEGKKHEIGRAHV